MTARMFVERIRSDLAPFSTPTLEGLLELAKQNEETLATISTDEKTWYSRQFVTIPVEGYGLNGWPSPEAGRLPVGWWMPLNPDEMTIQMPKGTMLIFTDEGRLVPTDGQARAYKTPFQWCIWRKP